MDTKGTSQVAKNDGSLETVADLTVRADRFNNFVELHRKDYFEDHSLEWCLDAIITRGIAEIERQVKTAEKAALNRAAGTLQKEFNMTPEQAKEAFKLFLANQRASAQAE